MYSPYDEILERAKCEVDDGTRDAEDALYEATSTELEEDWVCWELMQELFSPSELLDDDKYDVIRNAVRSELLSEVESYINDSIWCIHICEGPSKGDEYDSFEVYTEQEFENQLDDYLSEGYALIEKSDRDAYIDESEEEDED